MASVRSNGASPHPAENHRLATLDELGPPPEYARRFSTLGSSEPVESTRRTPPDNPPTPDEWMRTRYPEVFDGFSGDVFKRTVKGGRIHDLGAHALFARCLGPEGTPEAPMVYCPGAPGLQQNEGFYRYNPSTGLYAPLTRATASTYVDKLLTRCAEEASDGKRVHHLRKNRKREQVLTALEGEAEVSLEAFQPNLRRRHVANGILDLETLTLDPWSPEERSLSSLPVAWKQAPAFPARFVTWMCEMFPEPADRDLLLSVMALALLGNPAQKLVVITGDGNSGKSTLLKLMAELAGREASGQLRLERLDYQFEPRRWFGKLLLYTDEADGTIEKTQARQLKRLTGQTEYEAEFKRANETVRFKPRALPVLVSNGRVQVEMNDDQTAWRRRLVVLEAVSAGSREEELKDFEQVLLQEEGPGILQLVAQRAHQLLRWSEQGKSLELQTPRQRDRSHKVLRGFDPIPEFVRRSLEYSRGAKTYRGEVYDAAREWLRERDYQVPHKQTLAKRLSPLVERMGATVDNRMPDHPEYSAKGWTHVRLTRAIR